MKTITDMICKPLTMHYITTDSTVQEQKNTFICKNSSSADRTACCQFQVGLRGDVGL